MALLAGRSAQEAALGAGLNQDQGQGVSAAVAVPQVSIADG